MEMQQKTWWQKLVWQFKDRVAYALQPNRTIPRIGVHAGHFATNALICYTFGFIAAVVFMFGFEAMDSYINYRNRPPGKKKWLPLRDSAEDAMQLMAGATYMMLPDHLGMRLGWLCIILVPYIVRKVP